MLTKLINGLHGIVFVAGITGIGKSTLAAHLAADVVGPDYPGVYYESENRWVDAGGNQRSLAVDRMAASYGDDSRFEHLGYTDNYTQARDAALANGRGFIVIDTIQGSLDREDFDASRDAASHNAMNQRAHDLVKLADAGVAVLVVTHVNVRGLKGCPQPKHLKLSGALEQAAWIVGGYWRPTDKEHGIRAFQVTKERVRTSKRPVLHLKLSSDQGKLSEVALVERATPALAAPAEPRLSKAERVAQARKEHPKAGVREISGLAKVSTGYASKLMRA
jgi:hypothetical protein